MLTSRPAALYLTGPPGLGTPVPGDRALRRESRAQGGAQSFSGGGPDSPEPRARCV